jgi:outer membrane protein TolC
MKIPLFVVLLLFSFQLAAQKTLRPADLVAIIKKYHPVVKQADLGVSIAAAVVTKNRGAFDPVLRYNNNRKDFEGSLYYDKRGGQLSIPTWYGIDVYAGIESVEGSRTSAEETKGKLQYVGVSVPVVQNLLMDKRRAALQQAKIFRQASEADRADMVNTLLQEALVAYWDWWQGHQQWQLMQLALQNARTRFGMVQTTYRLGERPAIDTLEALTQVQLLEQKKAEIEGALQKSRLQLSLFLWNDTGAVDLAADVAPQEELPVTNVGLDTLLLAARTHPALQAYQFKLNALQVEKRLQLQQLLPQVDLKYHQLGRNLAKTAGGAWFDNNYRYGVSLSLPLRLSEGRGAYRQARLKIEQTAWAQAFKQLELQNKVKQFYAEWQWVQVQARQQAQLVVNYAALQRGEEVKFENGESSLFLMNTREQKTIEARQKQLALSAKKMQAQVNMEWAAGLLLQ